MRAQLAKQSDTWTKLNQFRVGRSFAHSLERHRVAATAWWASTFLFTELITAQLEQSTDVRQSRIEKKEKPLAFPERGPDRPSLRCRPNCVRATANAADRRGSRGNRRWTADLLLWQRRRDHNGRPLLSSTYATTRTYQWLSPITDHNGWWWITCCKDCWPLPRRCFDPWRRGAREWTPAPWRPGRPWTTARS